MNSSILASAATMRISRDQRRNVQQKLPSPGSSATFPRRRITEGWPVTLASSPDGDFKSVDKVAHPLFCEGFERPETANGCLVLRKQESLPRSTSADCGILEARCARTPGSPGGQLRFPLTKTYMAVGNPYLIVLASEIARDTSALHDM
jgi:hypothetical protein